MTSICAFEFLENRRLLAVTVEVVNRVLRISGDADDNEIEILDPNFTQVSLAIKIDGESTGSPVQVSSIDRIRIEGGGGEDFITVDDSGLPTVIKCGSGGDFILSRCPDTFVDGGKGADDLTMYGGVAAGGPGNDTIEASGSSDNENLMFGQGGDDEFAGSFSKETILGGSGNDRGGGGAGNDIFFGGSGSDTFSGSSGNDKLFGGTGRDALTGDPSGDDTIWGGAGKDTLDAAGGGNKNIHKGEKSNIDDIVADLLDEANEFLDDIGVDPIEL